MQGEIKVNGKVLSCACGTRLEGLPDAWRSRCAPKGKRNENYKHGARSMETIELWKRIKSLR
jgi:hypothetical protein